MFSVSKKDIPNRRFIAETITLRELPTAKPVPMLRMADVELTSVDWLWFPYIPFGKLTIIQGNPGEGKTYFAMRLAAACTNRKPLPGMETLEAFQHHLSDRPRGRSGGAIPLSPD